MPASILRFEQFELDLQSFELRKSGRVLKLEKLPMELLILLAEKRGQLVTREQIILRLWGDDVFVDTRQGINTAIRKIRVALCDDPEHPRLLQTVVGRGYRLLAPQSGLAEEVEVPEPPPSLPPCPPLREPPPPVEVPTLPATVFSGIRWRYGVAIAVFLFAVSVVGIHWVARPPSAQKVKEQRITSNPPEVPIKFAVISPDGKYVAYTDPTGLYLREISSGETRPWPSLKDFEASPNSWFPDGTHLLVTRFEGPLRTPSLWRLSLLGLDPLKLMDGGSGGTVSPDGGTIAYLRSWTRYGNELWMMESNGTNPRKIAAGGRSDASSYAGTWIGPVAWSPDGRRMAHMVCYGTGVPDPSEPLCSIVTRNASGSDPQVLMSDSGLRWWSWIAWVRDGRILYAYDSDRKRELSDESVAAVRVNERTGEREGIPQIISDGQGQIGGISVTSDGQRLVLWRRNMLPEAFLVEFEDGGRKLMLLRRLTLDANGNLGEAWMADSRAVLFVSNRSGTWKLFKQKIDETTAEVLVETRGIKLPRLSADRAYILYLTYTQTANGETQASLMKVPVAGGPPALVLSEKRIYNYQCARTPSQLCLLSQTDAKDQVFYSFDPDRGLGVEVARLPGGPTNWTLSPDGKKLAVFVDEHCVRMLSLDTGAVRDIRVEQWRLSNGDWSANGKLLFIQSVTQQNIPVMLSVEMSGKAEVLLEGQKNIEYWWLVSSPDGKYGILEAEVPGENNAWMLEKF